MEFIYWQSTNKINGEQYVESAMNLSSRLSDYFTNSYLKYQSTRGSAISIIIAILKYGLSKFSVFLYKYAFIYFI